MPWRQSVPPQSLAWAAAQAGAPVLAALPLPSTWLANHLLVLADGRELVLRRWARPGWADADPDLDAAREALVLARLADSEVPAPILVAGDPEGDACDVPALLLSRLPGEPFEGRAPLGPLVHVLDAIHAVDPAGIPAYRRHHEAAQLAVPRWAGDRAVWERAIAVYGEAPPSLPERFIHRDFHPGNTLWQGAALTGVVDWTSGSRGPAAVDLCHLRVNLVLAHGHRTADALLPHDDYHPYYDVICTLDALPDLGPGEPRAVWLRVEEHLARALAQL